MSFSRSSVRDLQLNRFCTLTSRICTSQLPKQTPISNRLYSTAAMATPFKIDVPSTETGLLNWKQTEASAKKATELLQKDLDSHHVFFNLSGFHNHIPHHILALYGTGADAAVLDQAFDTNASYQIRAMKPHTEIIGELRSDYAANARKYFSKGKHYPDFLLFFQEQIAEKGWEDTLKEFVFKGDALADELFGRLYAGFLHPIIQLMYGVEWKQPAIIAEGLAQAAVHDNRLGEYLLKVEAAAKSKKHDPAIQRTLPEVCESIPKIEKLAKSVHYGDKSNIFDGMVARAPEEAFELLTNITVDPNRLDEQITEMVHTTAYICAASAFRPPHIPKFDFFLIHHLNSSPIFVAFNQLSWIPLETKVRLLEWKMRGDAIQYVARGCPPLNFDGAKSYKPRDARESKAELVSEPKDLVSRFFPVPDDGHTIKVVRALLLAQKLSEKYANAAEPPAWLRIKDNDTWLRIHYALLDSVENAGEEGRWVRSAGFDEAWVDMPKL